MILVTGATGLVGSHLLVQLLQENEGVKALFRSEKQIEKVKNVFAFYNQTRLFDKINWVKGDITDIPSLEIAFENVTHVYHSKEPRKRARSSSRVNQSKDVFTGQPIDVSTGIAKAIKPKKETIAQRKAKLLGGKAVSFAFNGLKISEHNE